MISTKISNQKNWLIFYKLDLSVAPEFTELIWSDLILVSRRGQVHTWGSSNKQSFATFDLLLTEVARQRKSIEAEGFTLAREFSFNPTHFDFGLLQRELEISIRLAWQLLQKRQSNINAFALVSDSSAMTIGIRAHHFDSISDAEDEILWNPDEWEIGDCNFEESEQYYLDIPYRTILSQHQDDLPTKVKFSDYRTGFKKAVIGALESSIRSGLFGTDSERKNMIILFNSTDDKPNFNACKRLNIPELSKRLKTWWQS